MGIHEKAWAGLNILVYGKTPMLPMQLEQAIASASPENEIRVDSFEEYDTALDFAKDSQSVGFIFILENCSELPVADVFKQLSKPYESKGWPCFGILLYEKTESIKGLRTMQECDNIIGYHSVESILNRAKTANTLNSIWEKFNASFQEKIIPIPLQQTLLSIAEAQINQVSMHFRDRVTTLLSSNLNISWVETVSMRWNPIINAIKSTKQGNAIDPHVTLVQICLLSDPLPETEDFLGIANAKASLCSKVVTLTNLLDKKRSEGLLHAFLQQLGTISKPGAPALVRHTVNYRDRILAIAHEEEHAQNLESTG